MDHLSSSQINLYLQCSLKYKFQYIDKLEKPFKASALVLGSAIHSAISWFFKRRLAEQDAPLDRMYRIFEADWFSQRVEANVRYKEGETENGLILAGKEMLNLYFHQAPKNIVGTEVPFVVPLVHPENGEHLGINLEGFIDLIEAGDTIVEFKTSLKAMDAKDAKEHLQLSAYSYAYEILHQKLPKFLKIINFVKTKKPKIVPLVTKRGRVETLRFYYLARTVFRGIQAGIFFPRSSFMCSGCEYEGPCQAWKGA